jgi:hypothetical protein
MTAPPNVVEEEFDFVEQSDDSAHALFPIGSMP